MKYEVVIKGLRKPGTKDEFYEIGDVVGFSEEAEIKRLVAKGVIREKATKVAASPKKTEDKKTEADAK